MSQASSPEVKSALDEGHSSLLDSFRSFKKPQLKPSISELALSMMRWFSISGIEYMYIIGRQRNIRRFDNLHFPEIKKEQSDLLPNREVSAPIPLSNPGSGGSISART
jgi:hypothetical protein